MLCLRSICVVALIGLPHQLLAQALSNRGFVEGTVFVFPREAEQDRTQIVGDLLARDEVALRPARWFLAAAGIELRANTHDQVEDSWALDFSDRGIERPRLSIRRLAATLTRGPFTLELGKQFVRWGKTDIVVPTDRFAPRDSLTVIDAPYLAITAARATFQFGNNSLEGVWAPRFTPSRLPLPDQRWAVLPINTPPGASIVEVPTPLPSGPQAGVRWGQILNRFEYSVSFFDGFNHQPDIHPGRIDVGTGQLEFSRTYPEIRSYGADGTVPLPWFALKAEAAYVTSPSLSSDNYFLYVVQLERQSGEWLFVGGYVGEVVTAERAPLSFAPDRGLSNALVGRATCTIDANRSVEIEGAARATGEGVYVKGEYSQARGAHWRAILTGVVLAGDREDFIGQYRNNSHVRILLRYSF
jgi:hypothetical protein